MADTFHWLDVQRIAEELADAHPSLEPYSIGFPELRTLRRRRARLRTPAGASGQ
ncbi:MAG: Fe-S cluster assembly protein IscX [Phycisphaerales bacterium]|nr:Fe-S cluster assembly protein IscX [Phycisphaerales bacterium]